MMHVIRKGMITNALITELAEDRKCVLISNFSLRFFFEGFYKRMKWERPVGYGSSCKNSVHIGHIMYIYTLRSRLAWGGFLFKLCAVEPATVDLGF